MKILFAIFAIFLGFKSLAADYVQGNGTGTTAATVTFAPAPTGKPFSVVFVDVTSDKAGSTLKYITASDTRVVTGGSQANLTTFTVGSTNGVAGNVLVQRAFTATTFLAAVTNLTGGTTVVLTTSNAPLSAGDRLYILQTNTTPLGAATLRLAGECVFQAPAGPLLIQADGTSAVTVNNAVVK